MFMELKQHQSDENLVNKRSVEWHGHGGVAELGPQLSSVQRKSHKTSFISCELFLPAYLSVTTLCGDISPNELMLSHFMHNLLKC